MILIDNLQNYPNKRKQYAHMVSDVSLSELHQFAQKIGVDRHWFHKNHYDLRSPEHSRALNNGAIMVTTRELAKRMVKI